MKADERARISHLEDVPRDECLRLLGYGSYVGRIAFVERGAPMILTVNYVLDGESVVYRTHAGSRLSVLDGETVAFEAGEVQPLGRSGWSVVIQGRARAVSDPKEIDDLRRGPLRSWAWRAADQWMRISIDTIAGRRIPEN